MNARENIWRSRQSEHCRMAGAEEVRGIVGRRLQKLQSDAKDLSDFEKQVADICLFLKGCSRENLSR